jgi:hypothetical protein
MKTLVVMVLTLSIVFNQIKSAVAFKLHIHHNLTIMALGFLKARVLTDLADWDINVDVSHGGSDDDSRADHAYHFDNCLFKESTQTINRLYGRTLVALNPAAPDFNAASLWFGQILHPSQDFYSHSNWSELIEAGKTQGIVDDGLGNWTVLDYLPSFSTIKRGDKRVKVVQGEFKEEPYIPAGIRLTRDGSIVAVTMPDGIFPGLISGSSGTSLPLIGTDDDCPDPIVMTHAELNKDGQESLDYLAL